MHFGGETLKFTTVSGRELGLMVIYRHMFLVFFPAYFNDIPVGAVCCRVDHSQNQKRLYIMTLGCLAPYRRLGIGKPFVHVKQRTSDLYIF